MGRTNLAVVLASTFILGTASVTGRAMGQGPMHEAPTGALIFREKGCASCHTIRAPGARPIDLDTTSRHSYYDLAADLWNHLPTMASRFDSLEMDSPALAPDEAEALVAYLYTLDYFDPPGDPARGAQLFRARSCSRCHRVAGSGGMVGPDLDFLGLGSPIHVAVAMWNHAPAMRDTMRLTNIPRPTLAGDELRDIIAFVRAAAPGGGGERIYVLPGRADAGRQRFEDVGCARCHFDDEDAPGPNLANRARDLSRLEFAATMWNKMETMLDTARGRGIDLPTVRADEMADILAYLYAQGYIQRRGDVDRGAQLTAERGCLSCHTVRGQGEGPASDLATAASADSRAAILAALWNHVTIGRQYNGDPVPWPAFLPDEIAHIVAYLQSLR